MPKDAMCRVMRLNRLSRSRSRKVVFHRSPNRRILMLTIQSLVESDLRALVLLVSDLQALFQHNHQEKPRRGLGRDRGSWPSTNSQLIIASERVPGYNNRPVVLLPR